MIKHTDIKTKTDLANFLRCQEKSLDLLLNNEINIIDNGPNHHDKNDVREHLLTILNPNPISLHKLYIPKKNSRLGYRIVYSIKSYLFSNILKTLNTYLNSIYSPEDNVHGFVRNRNIKTNAMQHLSKKKLLSVDIENFFETITFDMINRSLIELGFNPEITTIISKIVTLNGFLVQGYHTSPTIANIVAAKFDKELLTICTEDIVYTRYADDLYFSSNKEVPSLEVIEEIICKNEFKLNTSKTKYMPIGSKQYVTGLSVFDKNYPRIPKRIKKKLRLEIYYIKKWGAKSHILKQLGHSFTDYKTSLEIKCIVNDEIEKTYARINGWILFIRSIEPELGSKLYSEFTNADFY
ncbi:MAG TPA: reverse transcriptase family protein [Ferruginibacter sp.]|jgi:RNA-directed DNA polymerase|nr:reverse transcriptase family protein [Ferruginibacter sp.]